jgi:hypothetical protein
VFWYNQNDQESIYLFCLVMELSTGKKMKKTLHHALRSFPSFWGGDTPSSNQNKINLFLKSVYAKHILQ